MSKLTLIIVIFTFIVFGAWFALDLLHTKPSVEVSPELQQALEPLDPTFDQKTIEKIQSLETIPSGPARPPAQTTITAPTTPTATPVPSATPIPPPNINFSTSSANLTP